MTARKSREQSTRAASPSHPNEFDVDDYYFGSSLLKTPKPPADKEYRWVRVGRQGGSQDLTNLRRRHREGWEPVLPSAIPQSEGDYVDMEAKVKIRGKEFDVIQIDDLVLMQRSAKLAARAKAANQKRIAAQLKAINSNIFGDTREQRQHGFAFDPEYRTRETRGQEPDTANSSTSGVHAEDVL